jgi:signal transduction histidine kinase
VGQHFSVFYSPEDRERGVPQRVLDLAQAAGSHAEEGWRIRKDGSRFWASVVVTPLYQEEGDRALIGYAKVTRDLTARKRAEEERVHRLEAEAALRAREEFISIAAHELKTPVTAVKAAAQLLQRRAARASAADPSLGGALEIVEQQVDKLGRLVTHLLDGARIQNGRLVIEPASTDIAALVRDAAASIAATTGRRIDVDAPPSLVVRIDGLRIEQVVANLLTNAAKFSPDVAPIEVTIAPTAPDRIELAVRDRGLGVPPERRKRLFERYFQAHDTRSGMGLGLYISRSIVEKHGGKIRAEFPDDGGSRFVVTLPA